MTFATSWIFIVILILAGVILMKLLKRSFGKALLVACVLLGFALFGSWQFVRARHQRESSMVLVSVDGRRHVLSLGQLSQMRDVDSVLDALSEDGQIEVVRYQDPSDPIELGRYSVSHHSDHDDLETVQGSHLVDVESREISLSIEQLKEEARKLNQEIGELRLEAELPEAEQSDESSSASASSASAATAIAEVAAELTSDEDYERPLCETCATEDCELCEDADEVEEMEDDGAMVESDGAREREQDRPQWTFDVKKWDGKTYRTVVTVTTHDERGIDDTVLREGFDIALAEFTKWYRERESLYSDWYDSFPFTEQHRSIRKSCLADTFTTRKQYTVNNAQRMDGSARKETIYVTEALFEFTGKRQRQIAAHYSDVRSLAKAGRAGGGFAVLLGALAGVFGYLKRGEKS